MKERPILFSGPMVRAILEGRKTQTRRIVKPLPWSNTERILCDLNLIWREYVKIGELINSHEWKCFYGKPGDRIWVRESFFVRGSEWNGDTGSVIYRADKDAAADWYLKEKWRPSIHMPRWASRITLEIANVRVERLNDISEEDAKAEGIESKYGLSKYNFHVLWNEINGPGSWEKNPWVWVIEFRRV